MNGLGFRWHYKLKKKRAPVIPVPSHRTVKQDMAIGRAAGRGQRLPGADPLAQTSEQTRKREGGSVWPEPSPPRPWVRSQRWRGALKCGLQGLPPLSPGSHRLQTAAPIPRWVCRPQSPPSWPLVLLLLCLKKKEGERGKRREGGERDRQESVCLKDKHTCRVRAWSSGAP